MNSHNAHNRSRVPALLLQLAPDWLLPTGDLDDTGCSQGGKNRDDDKEEGNEGDECEGEGEGDECEGEDEGDECEGEDEGDDCEGEDAGCEGEGDPGCSLSLMLDSSVRRVRRLPRHASARATGRRARRPRGIGRSFGPEPAKTRFTGIGTRVAGRGTHGRAARQQHIENPWGGPKARSQND